MRSPNRHVTIETLREFLEQFVEDEPVRTGAEGLWQKPLMVSARIDNRFDRLPEIAYREHMMPRDLLPSAKSVVVFFIPFRKTLIRENKKAYKAVNYPNATGDTTKPEVLFGPEK